jgi:hypothetical protein
LVPDVLALSLDQMLEVKLNDLLGLLCGMRGIQSFNSRLELFDRQTALFEGRVSWEPCVGVNFLDIEAAHDLSSKQSELGKQLRIYLLICLGSGRFIIYCLYNSLLNQVVQDRAQIDAKIRIKYQSVEVILKGRNVY